MDMENDNSLSVIYGIHIKMNWQLPKPSIFFLLNFNVYTDADNKERARARDKKQRRRLSWEEKHENYYVAAVRNWETLAATKVKTTFPPQNV